ncbi:uncharacterized protein LOC142321466 [Lycorma delicatula]|uniref:uncharacterized protein LOC142321466 n=1 Tax=Lycorma delicatula TaxID=130591 RepID=UPI003F50E890
MLHIGIKNFERVIFNRSFYNKLYDNLLCSKYCSCEPVQPCLDDIPYVELYENNPETAINIRDFCCGRKIVLFGVPGAFTPVCSEKQLPEYISRAEEFKKLGVDEIACVSVNDPFVMCAWGKHHNAQGRVRMFADTQAILTTALGVTIELPSLGGIRSKRYSMVLSNGRIQTFNIEPDGIGLSVSRAAFIAI